MHSEKNMASANGDPSDVLVLNATGGMSGLPSVVSWDPQLSKDWDQEKPTDQCILRMKRLLTELFFLVMLSNHNDLMHDVLIHMIL